MRQDIPGQYIRTRFATNVTKGIASVRSDRTLRTGRSWRYYERNKVRYERHVRTVLLEKILMKEREKRTNVKAARSAHVKDETRTFP